MLMEPVRGQEGTTGHSHRVTCEEPRLWAISTEAVRPSRSVRAGLGTHSLLGNQFLPSTVLFHLSAAFSDPAYGFCSFLPPPLHNKHALRAYCVQGAVLGTWSAR